MANLVKAPAVVNPGFWQKIVLRFRGIPLEGEAHAPRALFSDCDKIFCDPTVPPKVPKDYKEFPERDLANFPYPERPLYPSKTRWLMIPDSWCRPFEKVTGTSGPYLFFGGLAAFMVNKEIWVLEEHAVMLFGWVFWYLFASRAFGYRLDKWAYERLMARNDYLKKLVADDLKDAVEFRKYAAAEKESLAAVAENFPTIFKENLALQLEAVYRRNVNSITTELKRRVDYLQEVETTKERFERDILLQSITEGVYKQIANNEGNIRDNYLDNCIAQLKTLNIRS